VSSESHVIWFRVNSTQFNVEIAQVNENF
jgi:hypothetical protein